MVLRRGRWKGERGVTPRGGQRQPSSTHGASEECKYAQKNPKKNITSLAIRRRNPSRSEAWTEEVWHPRL